MAAAEGESSPLEAKDEKKVNKDGLKDENDKPSKSIDAGDNVNQKKTDETSKEETQGKAKTKVSVDFRPRYNARSKSILSNVLTEYGMPEEAPNDKRKGKENVSQNKEPHKDSKAAKTKQKRKEAVPKRKETQKVKRENTFESTASDEGGGMSEAKKEKYMQVYQDIHKLRDYFYEDYMGQLREKIEKQKDDISKKSASIERKMKERDEKLRKERQEQVKKRMYRVDLSENEDYFKRVPKSDMYKIVNLQQKMVNEGKLRTKADIDEFWSNIRRPEVFMQYFPDEVSTIPETSSNHSGSFQQGRSRTSSISSVEKAVAPLPEKEKTDYRPMTQIAESLESSRPPTREATSDQSWAITQMASTTHKNSASKKPRDPYTKAKLAAIELDKKYPALELPVLNCFSSTFNSEAMVIDQILKEKDKQRREKERRLFIKRLRRMYHLTQSNQASAQRILDNHADELELATNGPPLSELIAISEMNNYVDDDDARDPYDGRPWMKYATIRKRDINTIAEMPEDEFGEGSHYSSSVPSSAGRMSRRSAKKRDTPPTPPPPLSHTILEGSAPGIEASCLSTMWTNYERIGFHGHLAKQES